MGVIWVMCNDAAFGVLLILTWDKYNTGRIGYWSTIYTTVLRIDENSSHIKSGRKLCLPHIEKLIKHEYLYRDYGENTADFPGDTWGVLKPKARRLLDLLNSYKEYEF